MNKLVLVFAFIALSGTPAVFGQTSTSTPAPPVLQIVLSRFGVNPETVTVPAGPIILSFENRLPSRDEVASLASGGSSGEPVLASLQTDADNVRVDQLVTLNPGVFVLRFKDHPRYSIEITVEAQ